MKTLKNTVGILAAIMLLFTLSTNAQTGQLPEGGDDESDRPEKVSWVRESRGVIPESTSSVVLSYKSRSSVSRKTHIASESMDAVDFEEDIPLEDWMLSPFELQASCNGYPVEVEEEIQLEPWMLDLSSWE